METGDFKSGYEREYGPILEINYKILKLKDQLIDEDVSLIKMNIIKNELIDLMVNNFNKNIELSRKKLKNTIRKRNIAMLLAMLINITIGILAIATSTALLPILVLNIALFSFTGSNSSKKYSNFLDELTKIYSLNNKNFTDSLKIINNKTKQIVKKNEENNTNKVDYEKSYSNAMSYINNYIKGNTTQDIDFETEEIVIAILQNDLKTNETNLDVLLPKIKDFYYENTHEINKVLSKTNGITTIAFN